MVRHITAAPFYLFKSWSTTNAHNTKEVHEMFNDKTEDRESTSDFTQDIYPTAFEESEFVKFLEESGYGE